VTIDEDLASLERITRRLEEENLPLEEAISLFEEGISLAAKVKGRLDEAKLRVERVIEEAKGVFTLEDLELP